MNRIAFYGGSFDPLHNGHLAIARELTNRFALDEFVFIPAFHAPHKKDKKPTSAFHRFAMIAAATLDENQIKVSKMELELPERPYTVETLTRLKNELTNTEIFFVMGADSWQDITTWREWEMVLTMVNIIVVTRPDYEIGFTHINDAIRERIVDLRVRSPKSKAQSRKFEIRNQKSEIYITDAVSIDVSSTEIRAMIREKNSVWKTQVPEIVARYVEKYRLYPE